jgi:hypothetical protein
MNLNARPIVRVDGRIKLAPVPVAALEKLLVMTSGLIHSNIV